MSSEEHNIADYEEVLRVLPELFRETWKDNTDVLVYLAELGSLGLQRLSKEPDKLSEEKISILEQTQDLAFHNYKTFIQAAECSHKIFQDFNKIEFRLTSLVDNLPIFKDKCAEFGKEAQRINARWRQASSTLAKHPQLLEFLEMPQLMDTYVRNGYYDEALELSAYVKRLERKHMDIPLIKSIVQDVQLSTNVMLAHLLTKLRTNIQLPDCLKVVGYLRRMDVFNDSELRIKFLQARDAWFQKVINDIDKSDAYEHVIKVIESSRVHLFDITTQYRAIFSDDDPLLLVREDSKSNCAIFHSWIIWKISWFLDVLEKDISSDLGSRVDSVLAQCMYFGLSFSRVNIDFRPLLIPVFQNIALKKFCLAVERATFKFEKIIEAFAFTMYTNTTLLVTTLSQDSLQPPAVLLDFYPLAQYCNDILCALNEIKLCCSFAMSNDVVNTLYNSLNRLVNVLVSIHSKRSRRMSELEVENFNKFCFLLCSDLVPHLNKCLSVIFPPETMCLTLGITPLEFKKYEYLCKLNASVLLEPLQVILPSKDDDDVGLTFSVPSKDDDEPIPAGENTNTSRIDGAELNESSGPGKEISEGTEPSDPGKEILEGTESSDPFKGMLGGTESSDPFKGMLQGTESSDPFKGMLEVTGSSDPGKEMLEGTESSVPGKEMLEGTESSDPGKKLFEGTESPVVSDEKNSNVEEQIDTLPSDVVSNFNQNVEQTVQMQEMVENVQEMEPDKID